MRRWTSSTHRDLEKVRLSTRANGSEDLLALKDGKWVVLRVPLPVGVLYDSVTNLNASILAGIEGLTKKGWKWNFSSVYGGNSNELFLTNTNNASQYLLGKNAQTSYEKS